MENGRPKKEVSESLEARAWRLRVEGKLSYRAIAKRLGVRLATAHDLVVRAKEDVQSKFYEDARQVMLDHTELLEDVAAQVWADYQQAKKPTTTTRVKQKLATTEDEQAEADANGMVSERVTETNPGKADAALFGQYRSALADIRDIWGAKAATVLALTGQDAADDDETGADNGGFAGGMFVDGVVGGLNYLFGDAEGEPAAAPSADSGDADAA